MIEAIIHLRGKKETLRYPKDYVDAFIEGKKRNTIMGYDIERIEYVEVKDG